MKTLLIVLLVVALGVVGLGLYKTHTTPADLYVFTGEFAGCPARPSCVSSVASDDAHRVPALAHTGDTCLLYTSPSPRDRTRSRMPSSA